MAHFAQLDENNIVVSVITVSNDVVDNLEFPDSEPKGVSFCRNLFGENTRWVQTSYNSTFRYNYAAIKYFFDDKALPSGAFIPPSPYPSWVLNRETYRWESPIPYPDDGKPYRWDEESQAWVEIQKPPVE